MHTLQMPQQARGSFIAAAVISIAVHATAAVYFGHDAVTPADRPPAAAAFIQISLVPTVPVLPKSSPQAPSEAAVRPEPEPVPAQKPAPRPLVKRKPLPEPVATPPSPAEVAPAAVAHNREQATATAIPAVPVNTPDPPAPEARRESYLLRLLAHIDAHKFYPRSARRRGLEGEVQIAFHLHADGSISELQVEGGSKLLRQAAKRAVLQALTLPPPPASVRLQEQIRFAMVYRLDG